MAKLSTAQVDEIAEKREKGWSYERLADRFDVSPGAIHYQCLKNGAVSPRQRRPVTPSTRTTHVTRDGKLQRRFTADDDVRILALEAQGLSMRAIAEAMGRAPTSFRVRLLTLALREDMPA